MLSVFQHITAHRVHRWGGRETGWKGESVLARQQCTARADAGVSCRPVHRAPGPCGPMTPGRRSSMMRRSRSGPPILVLNGAGGPPFPRTDELPPNIPPLDLINCRALKSWPRFRVNEPPRLDHLPLCRAMHLIYPDQLPCCVLSGRCRNGMSGVGRACLPDLATVPRSECAGTVAPSGAADRPFAALRIWHFAFGRFVARAASDRAVINRQQAPIGIGCTSSSGVKSHNSGVSASNAC